MRDEKIIKGFRQQEETMSQVVQALARLEEEHNKLVRLSARRAFQEDCWRRALGAVLEDRGAALDAFWARPWYRRLLRRPPAAAIRADEVVALADGIRAKELSEMKMREQAAAAARSEELPAAAAPERAATAAE